MDKIILLLYLLRLYACFLPGYIHPDEFFQGGQELFFSSSTNTNKSLVWEYDVDNAIRSILPPSFMTLYPLKLYNYVLDKVSSHSLIGKEILLVPRLFLHVVSLLSFDLSLWLLLRNIKKEYKEMNQNKDDNLSFGTYLWIMASSWPVIIFTCRPFSNTLEATLLNILLVTISNEFTRDYKKYSSSYKIVIVGFLCSVGIFVRFTFIFFAIAPILFLVHCKSTSSPNTTSSTSMQHLYSACYAILQLLLGFLPTCIGCIFMDHTFYNRSNNDSDTNYDTILSYVTPLNALLYNSNMNNLSNHGIHPRITHLFINLPMLFGPLALLFYFNVLQKLRIKKNKGTKTQQMCFYSILSSLCILSCAPHQEPRFLLPLTLPFIILYSFAITQKIKYAWICFNLILGIFFGYFHQSGVIPSLFYLQSLDYTTTTDTVIYFHTYMPPTFPFSKYDSEYMSNISYYNHYMTSNQDDNIPKVIDLKGANHSVLNVTLSNYLSCSSKQNTHINESFVYLVAPTSVMYHNMLHSQYSFQSIYEYHPHVTTEDFPSVDKGFWNFWDDLRLVVSKVQCIDPN